MAMFSRENNFVIVKKFFNIIDLDSKKFKGKISHTKEFYNNYRVAFSTECSQWHSGEYLFCNRWKFSLVK